MRSQLPGMSILELNYQMTYDEEILENNIMIMSVINHCYDRLSKQQLTSLYQQTKFGNQLSHIQAQLLSKTGKYLEALNVYLDDENTYSIKAMVFEWLEQVLEKFQHDENDAKKLTKFQDEIIEQGILPKLINQCVTSTQEILKKFDNAWARRIAYELNDHPKFQLKYIENIVNNEIIH
jgi:uncharacterized membrane-anchored protein YjiN (DUF445 family)